MFITRVKSRRGKEDPKTYRWLDELRKTSAPEVHPVNPYAEVFSFRTNIYSIFVESADGMGDTWHHLIIGPEKAMLIDTGFGIGNLKGLVDELTNSMPLIVANTHEHLDHTFGNCQFDTVYCHEYAVEGVMNRFAPDMWDHLYDENGKGKWYDCDIKDKIAYKQYHLIGVQNHTLFNLGGDHNIELIHTPGHAAGGASFLDKQNRILFTGAMHTAFVSVGGAVNRPGKYNKEFSTVTAFRNALVEIAARVGEFDVLMPAHEIQEVDSSFVFDMLDLCNQVIAAPDSFDDVRYNRRGIGFRCKSLRQASLAYVPEGV